MTIGGTLILIGIDFAVICVCAMAIGIPAPRWPDRWLDRDRGPLKFRKWDRPDVYRRLHAPLLIRILPEGGSWTGGESKSALFGSDRADLERYLIEVRRAEWVHMLMLFAWVPLVFFNPWPMLIFWIAFVVIINGLFLTVLRFNRVRLTRILNRSA